jgi:hypothetical protein
VPAYLESTLEAAPLYERFGFRAVERISMMLGKARGGGGEGGGDGGSEGGKEGEGEEVIYEEICFLYRPEEETPDGREMKEKRDMLR